MSPNCLATVWYGTQTTRYLPTQFQLQTANCELEWTESWERVLEVLPLGDDILTHNNLHSTAEQNFIENFVLTLVLDGALSTMSLLFCSSKFSCIPLYNPNLPHSSTMLRQPRSLFSLPPTILFPAKSLDPSALHVCPSWSFCSL